jgi:hypothetical protein
MFLLRKEKTTENQLLCGTYFLPTYLYKYLNKVNDKSDNKKSAHQKEYFS